MTESKQKKSQQKPKRRMRRANGVATRQRIFETASAMFAAGGFEATSLRQIASASSVDIATLKYHFRDKTELYSEVYRVGHENLLDHLKPCLDSLSHAKTKDELLVSIEDFVFAFHDFLEEDFAFLRMLLFRLLEGSEAISHIEEELQGIAASLFDEIFRKLLRRKLVRDIDHRAFITVLVSSLTTWFVIAEVKPDLVEEPLPFTFKGRERSEAFFCDMFERILVE